MPDPDGFEALLARFARLGRADREAVMAALGPDERAQVAAAIARQVAAGQNAIATAREAGRQYAGYSPWLAAIVRSATEGDPLPGAVGERVRRAVTEAHGSTGSSNQMPTESLWNQVRRLGTRLIDGEARPR